MPTIAQIVARLEQTRHGIIGVDGNLGAGKTQVANRLAAAPAIPCVHLEDSMARGLESFLRNVDYEALRREIGQYKSGLVIEGICLLAALSRVGCMLDYLVFVDSESQFNTARKSM
jgi:hypothetical protein